ncbi:Fungal-type protein kinase [Fusarium oxysporum f. sp. vasinfectum]|nr:Fungal-type protein kinase [Fusarium oxysporum f. sp. vasinfectum]
MENNPAVNHPPAPPATATDDQEILDNIDGRMHGPMSGFIKKYFSNFRYVRLDDLLEIQAAGRIISRCAVPSAAPSPDNFLPWFSNYVSRELDGARGSWHISNGNVASQHESVDDGARLLLTMPTSLASNIQTRWDHVQVIGQFYHRGCVCYQDGLLRLCRSAHQVFASQPTRLFLHGFYIRGSLIELWVFDRSGLYCSDVFDVRKDFIQFLSIILSYQRMTDQDLGKINIIETNKVGRYIILDSVVKPSLGKLYLESQPIASREGLVGTGTTCYRARMPDSNRWNYVLKFKWRWARERPEDELLKLAKKKCVWGAVSLDYYKEIETIRDAIKCHRSLCYDAKILHQDISPGNMIILDDQDEGKPNGILIDLDSATEVTEGLGAEPGITGTRPFMAIGVLKGECHTYRHDLESFLYVFLWTVITNHTENPPETSKLRQWSNGDWNELAVRKALDMNQDNFRNILEEFTPEFHSLKPLAESLRQILFPLRDGVIWTGTDGSPEAVSKLYDGITRAFEEAIASEGGR